MNRKGARLASEKGYGGRAEMWRGPYSASSWVRVKQRAWRATGSIRKACSSVNYLVSTTGRRRNLSTSCKEFLQEPGRNVACGKVRGGARAMTSKTFATCHDTPKGVFGFCRLDAELSGRTPRVWPVFWKAWVWFGLLGRGLGGDPTIGEAGWLARLAQCRAAYRATPTSRLTPNT